MSLSFVNVGTLHSWAGASSVVVGVPAGVAVGDLLIVGLAFENVAAGSGPWVDHVEQGGWHRLTYAAPSALGSGLEVWWANWGEGPTTKFVFDTTRTGVTREVAYRCPSGEWASPTGWSETQFTGSNPTLAAVDTQVPDTLVTPIISFTLSGAGFTFPAGYTKRVDNARSGAFGNVEYSIADQTFASAGSSGTIAVTAPASPVGAAGVGITAAWACTQGRLPHLLPMMGVGA